MSDYELAAAERASLLRKREARLSDLRAAMDRVRAEGAWTALQELMEILPEAVSVEIAALALREPGPEGRMQFVAASGLTGRELARLACEPLSPQQAWSVLAAMPDDRLSRSLGLLWGTGHRLANETSVGLLLVGSRTRRGPEAAESRLIELVARDLEACLTHLRVIGASARRRALALARDRGAAAALPDSLGVLRPREVLILELYGEGLATTDIAELLVVSPFTVRTHVRNALRRLGVRSRREAVTLLHERHIPARQTRLEGSSG